MVSYLCVCNVFFFLSLLLLRFNLFNFLFSIAWLFIANVCAKEFYLHVHISVLSSNATPPKSLWEKKRKRMNEKLVLMLSSALNWVSKTSIRTKNDERKSLHDEIVKFSKKSVRVDSNDQMISCLCRARTLWVCVFRMKSSFSLRVLDLSIFLWHIQRSLSSSSAATAANGHSLAG